MLEKDTAEITDQRIANLSSIIIRTICIIWFIQRIKGYKIWLFEDRLYPVIPVFEFLEGYPPLLQASLYYIAMACMLLLVLKPKLVQVQLILVLSVFLSAILEMAAWQPWEYQYLCMMAAFLISRKNSKALFTVLILIMASIYFYSGLQKFNGGFLHSVWKGLILRQFFGFSNINLLVHYAGLALPIIEALAGLGLIILNGNSRKKIVYILISMHFFILVLLGNLHGYNIVLPWNVAMIIILHYLFIKNETDFVPQYLLNKKLIVFTILWAIMPATSFFGYWEQKLSSNLFSGKYEHLIICTDNIREKEILKYVVTNNKIKICNNQYKILVSEWSKHEMAVVVPTSDWYYKKLKRNFRFNTSKNLYFYKVEYPYKKFLNIN